MDCTRFRTGKSAPSRHLAAAMTAARRCSNNRPLHIWFAGSSGTCQAIRAGTRMAGLRRAAFWRQLGFPNCALATKARMEKRRQRKQFEELEALQQPRSPYRRRAERKDGTTSYSALAARGPAPASSAKPSFKSSEEG